jgi:hypothetical protein
MKFITIVLLLLGGHNTFAANLPASLMSAQAKLASLKSQLDADISGLPNIPLPKLQPKTSVPLTGQVPDFENRKVTLETLKAKLSAMQAAQLKAGKPNPAFLAEMKQTLEESLAVKMVKLEVPKFNPNAPKPIIPVAKKVSNPRMATVEKRIRNVENFTAELYRLHDEFTNAHRIMLEDTRVERNAMTDVVFGVFNAISQSFGKILEKNLILNFYFSFNHRSNHRRPLANSPSRPRPHRLRRIHRRRSRLYQRATNRICLPQPISWRATHVLLRVFPFPDSDILRHHFLPIPEYNDDSHFPTPRIGLGLIIDHKLCP